MQAKQSKMNTELWKQSGKEVICFFILFFHLIAVLITFHLSESLFLTCKRKVTLTRCSFCSTNMCWTSTIKPTLFQALGIHRVCWSRQGSCLQEAYLHPIGQRPATGKGKISVCAQPHGQFWLQPYGQAPLSMAFPGKNAGAGVISSSRGLPDPGIELVSLVLPALAGGSFHCITWKAPQISKRYQAVISKIEGCESKCIDTTSECGSEILSEEAVFRPRSDPQEASPLIVGQYSSRERELYVQRP